MAHTLHGCEPQILALEKNISHRRTLQGHLGRIDDWKIDNPTTNSKGGLTDATRRLLQLSRTQ